MAITLFLLQRGQEGICRLFFEQQDWGGCASTFLGGNRSSLLNFKNKIHSLLFLGWTQPLRGSCLKPVGGRGENQIICSEKVLSWYKECKALQLYAVCAAGNHQLFWRESSDWSIALFSYLFVVPSQLVSNTLKAASHVVSFTVY